MWVLPGLENCTGREENIWSVGLQWKSSPKNWSCLLSPALLSKNGKTQELVEPHCKQDWGTDQAKINPRWREIQFSSNSPKEVFSLKKQSSTGWEWAVSAKAGRSAGGAGYCHDQDRGKKIAVHGLFMNSCWLGRRSLYRNIYLLPEIPRKLILAPCSHNLQAEKP